MDGSVNPLEVLAIVRSSLSDVVTSLEGGPETHTPHFAEVLQGVRFSRKFVWTYYGVIGLLLVVFTAAHWSQRARRRRRKLGSERVSYEAKQPFSASTSSSSSTLLADDVPSDPVSETSPLLSGQHHERTTIDHGDVPSAFYRHWKAFVNYQPRPIPALTAPINSVPTNGTTLLILLGLAVNIFYLFFRASPNIPTLFIFADRAGLCFVMNLPVLYALAAKNNQPILSLTGWSYEGLNIFHRRLGEWMTIVATLHCVGMFGVWYTILRPVHFSLWRFMTTNLVLLGMFAFATYLTIYITSVGWIRRLYYELFLGSHVLLQVAALVLLFFHHSGSRPFVVASLVIWALDRLVTRIFISSKTFVATLQIAADRRTVLMFVDIPIRQSSLRTNITSGWQPSHHVFVTVPGMGSNHALQSHPFTISSPAPQSADATIWPLQLTIRAQEGFSKDLIEYAKLHQHTEVRIDGPYGSLDALEAARAADRVCLVAGGSGIAVTYPLAWSLYARNADRPVSSRVTYENGVKQVPSLAYRKMPKSNDRFRHIWVNRDQKAADSWVTMFPRYEGDGSLLVDKTETVVTELVTHNFETSAMRPDLKAELSEWVLEGSSTSTSEGLVDISQHRIVVVVSGPDSLVRDVRQACTSLTRRGFNVSVHVEKFEW